jgi:hypothetical protein
MFKKGGVIMKWLESRVLWGAVLIIGGVLFLLQNLNVLQLGDLAWAILLGLVGVYILTIYISNRTNWWALIPGIVLIDLAVILGLQVILPSMKEFLIGSLFLAGIGLAFWAVYLNNRDFWWAVIPGGVLFTLAIVAGISEVRPGLETGGIFFLGLGATFALLAVLPSGGSVPAHALRWALIPAGVLIIMGLLLTAASASLINYIWPVVLILAGLFLVYNTLASRRVQK